MRRYAEGTAVPIARSRAEIDRLLRAWGATGIQWTDEFDRDRVTLAFLWRRGEANFHARFAVQLPDAEKLKPAATDGRTGRLNPRKLERLLDGRGRQEHRILALWLKAALNAVEAGIVAAEALFLPWLVGADGQTVAEVALPRLDKLLGSSARALLPAVASAR